MKEVNSLIIFDIKGPMAHFRAFYTNSSSLSYTFPPRTTITGLIAGLLGWERDCYYEELSSQKCSIALSIKSPMRKIMQTINYVRTKSLNELNASGGHTQIPLEIIVPAELDSQIFYRIYFAYSDRDIMQNLEKRLKNNAFVFPPYLGLSEFIAKVKFVDFIGKEKIAKINKGARAIETSAVINVEKIERNGLVLDSDSYPNLQYMRERMPVEFDINRKIKSAASFIYEKNQKKIKVILKEDFYRISYQDYDESTKSEDIVFME